MGAHPDKREAAPTDSIRKDCSFSFIERDKGFILTLPARVMLPSFRTLTYSCWVKVVWYLLGPRYGWDLTWRRRSQEQDLFTLCQETVKKAGFIPVKSIETNTYQSGGDSGECGVPKLQIMFPDNYARYSCQVEFIFRMEDVYLFFRLRQNTAFFILKN